jgi:very-short-patch-repair endonuclease
MKTARPLPAALKGRPFTAAEAAQAGVSDKRLQHRSLTRLGKGIREDGPTDELPLSVRVRPFIEVNERCAASHQTAAELLLLPHNQRKEPAEMFHIIRPEGAADLKRPHVIVHRMKLYEDEVTVHQGIPVTTPERTWLDLAEVLSLDALVVAGDSCVRVPRPEYEGRDQPLCTIADLQRMIDRHKGKRGLRKAKEALRFVRVGSDSPQETLLRLAIVWAGLPEPELNVPILDTEGVGHHAPDLSYRRYRVGIEYEGEHHGEELQVVRDITRSERYSALGWTEVRISKRHMMDDGKQAVAKVRTALVQAGWRPGR